MNNFPVNTILASSDVESLYTSILQKDESQTVSCNTTADFATRLCHFVLIHVQLKIGDNLFLQLSSTSMGTCMAPEYANIFIADLKQHFLNHTHSDLFYSCNALMTFLFSRHRVKKSWSYFTRELMTFTLPSM